MGSSPERATQSIKTGLTGPQAQRRISVDGVAEWLHPLFQNRFGELACAAQDERAKILVPVSFWRGRPGPYPGLQLVKVAQGNTALVNAFQNMMPDGAGKISELNLRQWNPSRIWSV